MIGITHFGVKKSNDYMLIPEPHLDSDAFKGVGFGLIKAFKDDPQKGHIQE